MYIDGNNNGVQDSGELGILGAVVDLVGMNNAGQPISLTATTDAGGHYLFTALLSGTYTVEEPQPAKFDDGKDAAGAVTAGASGAQDSWSAPDRFAGVTLATQDAGINYNFGEIGTSIGGTVFRDQTKNGGYDAGTDTPLAAVTVGLYDSTGTVPLATTTTGSDGNYLFSNLPVGTYVVKETQPSGYVDTIGAAGPNTRTVVAPAGGIGGVNFGETLGSILGTVWLDANKNGVRDGMGDPITPPTDPGIAGVTVTLYDATGNTVLQTATTDASGNYIFDNLLPGTYVVKESQPLAYTDAADFYGSLGGSVTNDEIGGIILAAGAVGTVYDFSEQGAIVSGTVWNDRDADGVIDPTEPGRLSGVLVTLDDGNTATVDPTAVTDPSGFYQFIGVPVGTYTLVETQPPDWVSTLPADNQISARVVSTAGVAQDLPNQNFGESASTIGDTVFNDRDGNGVQGSGEPGIPGVTVTITASVSGVPLSFTTTTDAAGKYAFNDLPLGVWTATINTATLPAGMTQTSDADGIATANTSSVTIDAAHLTSLVQDFGYRGAGALGDLVWNDMNGSTTQESGEPGLPGVRVTATITIAGTPITYTTTTDASGAYSLTGLPLGTYTVAVDAATLPGGLTQTFDADGVASANTSVKTLTTLAPTSITQDFGYRGSGTIGDLVWADTNGDQGVGALEPGLPGVPVTLTTVISGTTVTYTTTTDNAGGYTVTGLPYGTYAVTTTPDSSLMQTFDADGALATPNTSAVTLDATAPTSTTQDFGYEGGGSIGDLIWIDTNGDGTRQTTEPGIPGVEVAATATIGGSTVRFVTVTGANGAYLFTGLPYGSYTVTVTSATLPAGLTQTGDPDATKDSTSTVTLSSLAPSSIVKDFGYQGAGSIGDLIWSDTNGDGTAVAGEPGLPGVKVTITTRIAGSPVFVSATTDSAGHYSVVGLPYGTYSVVVDPLTLPAGVAQTGDPDATKDDTSTATLSMLAPSSVLQDFGYEGVGTIGELVWLDANGNGLSAAGEPGLPGVVVTASTVIAGSTVTYTTTTDAGGFYTFSGLPLGTFTVSLGSGSLPAGAVETYDVDGLATANGSVSVLTVASPSDVSQDFGFKGPGTIGNVIWNDLDGGGVQGPGEPGLPGVTVRVTAVTGGSPVTLTVTTGADGSYRFDGLPLLAWTVAVDPVTLPGGVVNTGDPDGGFDSTAVVTLEVGAPLSSAQNFGFRGPASLGDLVWVDTNANGVPDPGEAGVAGVGITITSIIGGSTVTYHAVTDSSGGYLVAGLPLGSFTIAVDLGSLPAGVTQTSDGDGLGTANASAVALAALTPASLTQDFGYKGPGSIGDTVFNDLNGNGAREIGEPGLPGVKVTATATVGGSTFKMSAVTAADGSYIIAGLPLATFTVTVDPVTLPVGVVQTADPDLTLNSTSTVMLTAVRPVDTLQDFGYQGPGALGNLIWNDLNGDGLRTNSEPGIPGVDVTITTIIAGATVTYSATTDPFGAYQVDGLPLGTFTIAVDPASLPAGMTATYDATGPADDVSIATLSAATPTSDTQDFGYQGPGTIGDIVWNDLNADGAPDPGESGIPGVALTVTTVIGGATVTYTTATGADGSYSIVGLPLGDFDVTVNPATLANPMVQTFDFDGTGTGTGDTSAISLTASTPVSLAQDFGYVGDGVIGDLIWNDRNGDGLRTADEPGLPGVKVTITTQINGTTVAYTDVTDTSGAYLVSGLPLGTYTVTIDPTTLPGGVVQTGDPDSVKDHTSTVQLTLLAPASGTQDFGYQGPGAIGNSVWNDLNGDGIQQPTEPGLPGVDIKITTVIAGATVTYMTTTTSDGRYTVAGLSLGTFTVRVDPSTLPVGVLPVTDGDDPSGVPPTTPSVSQIILEAATPIVTTQDFGYRGPGAIGDLVFNDLNANGVQDLGEPGLPRVAVSITTLVNGTTVTYAATTDANGAYAVSGLPIGDFTVAVRPSTLPGGLVATGDPVGVLDGISTMTLTASVPTDTAQDFGYQGPGSIGDLVWNDLDGEGDRDTDEPGMPGVTVTITTVVNGTTVTYTAITDSAGTYRVSGLPLGDFTVTIDPASLPGGLVSTRDASGPADGVSMITLTASEPVSNTQDFAYQGPGKIGDLVWNDLNGDGLKTPNEPGLPGVVIDATANVAGATVTYTATTAADGSYQFAGLPLGSFTVAIDPTMLPSLVLPTADPDGGGDNTAVVILTDVAPIVLAEDFGYRGPGTIGDLVWNDTDANGVQGPNEPGIPGVAVTITTTVNDQQVTYITTTNPAGGYSLAGLPLGRYTVTINPATVAAGLLPVADADGGNNNTSAIALTVAEPISAVQDFGYKGPGSIGNTVWNDMNGDGAQASDEPGLPGVQVTAVVDINGTPVTYTTTTGRNGTYTFTGLPLGSFTVTLDPTTLPSGVLPSFDRDGTATPNTSVVTLTAELPTSTVQDFGYQGPGRIGDLVWNDLNGNGTAGSDEPGFANVAVTLTTTVGGTAVTYATTTDGSGSYRLQGLPLGSYTVTLNPAALPATVQPTFDGDGFATVNTSAVTLTASAPISAVQDFGFVIPASIGDLIWNDLNANGLQDPNEPGLGGVTVHLVGVDGLGNPVDLTTTTGTGPDAGTYLFPALAPGDYTVTVSEPSGFVEAPISAGTDRLVDSNGLVGGVTLVSGTPQPGVDAGMYELSSISGTVFADLDANGLQGTGCVLTSTRHLLRAGATACELGIGGVTVTLTGTTGSGVPVSLTTTTAADGTWSFAELVPGSYTVAESQPAAWSDGVDTPPPGAVSNMNDVIAGISLLSGTPIVNVTFGEQGWTVVGRVTIDGTNAPVGGVTMTLTGTDVLDEPITRTVQTAPDGRYEFANVPPGSYTLTETQPVGLTNGATNPTNTVAFVLDASAQPPKNFSETGSDLSGIVYVDVNKNHANDAGDEPSAGVRVTISGTDDGGNPVSVTVVTDANGAWSVAGLRAGTYQVTETQPSVLRDGSASLGSAGGTVVDPNTMMVTLSSGTNATGYQFGDVRVVLPVTGGTPIRILEVASLLLALGLAMRISRRRARLA